jgi:hypothetical protein
MAASINRQVAQELKRRLKVKGVNHREALQLVKWIAVFQGLNSPENSPSEVPEQPVPQQDSGKDVLGGLT